MKRLVLFFVISTFILTLSACGLGGNGEIDDMIDDNDIIDDNDNGDTDNGDPDISQEEAAALALTGTYDGDLTFLSSRVEAMNLDEMYEIESVLTMSSYNPQSGVTETVTVESIERYIEYAEGFIVQQIRDIYEDDVMVASLNMISDYHGNALTVYVDISDVYSQLEMMQSPEMLTAFGIEAGWATFTFSDSMTNMIEVEVFGEFLRAVVIAQDPSLEDLDGLEDYIVTMLGIDKTTANIELQLLFDTLFSFDLNAIMAHIFNINVDVIIDGGIENVVEPDLLMMMESYETELKAAGVDYDTYHTTLSTDGFFTLLETMSVNDANIIGSYTSMPFLGMLVEVYLPSMTHPEFAQAFMLAMLPSMRTELEFNGIDYDALYATVDGLNVELFLTQAETFDYNAMIVSLIDGTYMTFYNAMTETEVKAILELFNTMLFNQLGPVTAFFSYDFLINDLTRFNSYIDIMTYMAHEDMIVSQPVIGENYIVETPAFMTFDMLESISQSFLQDVWLWFDQLDYLDLPQVDPINCTGTECDSFDPYIMFLDVLSTMDDMPVIVTVDPLDESTMWITADLSNLMNKMMNDSRGNSEPYSVTLDVTIRSTTTIDAITPDVDLNQTLEEFAKFTFINEIRMMMEAVSWNTTLQEGMPVTLKEVIDDAKTLGIFDDTLTTFTLNNGDIEATFVYVDGKTVFDNSVTLSHLNSIFDNATMSRNTILSYIDLLDETTFSMTRLILLFMSEDMYYDTYYADPYYYQ